MTRSSGVAEALWRLQDLYERLTLAEAEQVKVERLIRELVRYRPNRTARYGVGGRVPLYTDPASAVEALKELMGLAWLSRPGMKNRIKPQVLLERWERAANETAVLTGQYNDLRLELASAGVDVG